MKLIRILQVTIAACLAAPSAYGNHDLTSAGLIGLGIVILQIAKNTGHFCTETEFLISGLSWFEQSEKNEFAKNMLLSPSLLEEEKQNRKKDFKRELQKKIATYSVLEGIQCALLPALGAKFISFLSRYSASMSSTKLIQLVTLYGNKFTKNPFGLKQFAHVGASVSAGAFMHYLLAKDYKKNEYFGTKNKFYGRTLVSSLASVLTFAGIAIAQSYTA